MRCVVLSQSRLIEKIILLNNEVKVYSDRVINRITDIFDLEKLTSKLISFYEYDFKQFRTELKKQKITLSLKQQDVGKNTLTNTKQK